jgi:pimeloyl-ACP methyl ester carboxylesterase
MPVSVRRRRSAAIVGLVALALAGVVIGGYAGYAAIFGSEDLIRPARSADCRTPATRYGWAYEAINYDATTDAQLRPVEDPPGSGIWRCDGHPAAAGALVVSADGTHLAGWYIPAADASAATGRTLVLVHGRSSNKSQYLRYGVPLHERFNLVLPDLRDAGQSDAADETMGVREAQDVEAFVGWLEAAKHPTWIGIVGTSQGGAAALEAAAGDPRIRAVVLDSTHSRIAETVARGIEQDRHLPAFPAQAAAFFGAWIRTGVDLSSVDPVDVIPRLGDRPLLIVHGGLDSYDPPLASALPNYAAAIRAGVLASIDVCPRGAHDAVIDRCPSEWASWVTTFLDQAAGS